jgi:hypothetical protein
MLSETIVFETDLSKVIIVGATGSIATPVSDPIGIGPNYGVSGGLTVTPSGTGLFEGPYHPR